LFSNLTRIHCRAAAFLRTPYPGDVLNSNSL